MEERAWRPPKVVDAVFGRPRPADTEELLLRALSDGGRRATYEELAVEVNRGEGSVRAALKRLREEGCATVIRIGTVRRWGVYDCLLTRLGEERAASIRWESGGD